MNDVFKQHWHEVSSAENSFFSKYILSKKWKMFDILARGSSKRPWLQYPSLQLCLASCRKRAIQQFGPYKWSRQSAMSPKEEYMSSVQYIGRWHSRCPNCWNCPASSEMNGDIFAVKNTSLGMVATGLLASTFSSLSLGKGRPQLQT